MFCVCLPDPAYCRFWIVVGHLFGRMAVVFAYSLRTAPYRQLADVGGH